MSGPNRQEILRKECKACFGNGYKLVGGNETVCELCGGSGSKEISVPFKEEMRSPEEIEQLFADN